jgi:phosphopantetheine adenylyltransferase
VGPPRGGHCRPVRGRAPQQLQYICAPKEHGGKGPGWDIIHSLRRLSREKHPTHTKVTMADQEILPALLILPSLSMPLRRSSLRSAYGISLGSLFQRLLVNGVHRLDIAVVLSTEAPSTLDVSRNGQFPSVRRLLEEYYRLICTVAAKEQVDLDLPGGIDVRIILFYAPTPEEARIGRQTLSGPLIDIHTFATSNHSYGSIYVAESEEGGRALAAVAMTLRLKNKLVPPIERLPCGSSIAPSSGTFLEQGSSAAHHYSVIVGGTFDHLHIGHKLLLSATVFLAEPTAPPHQRLITIGITGDELLVNKSYASQVESWDVRQANAAAFIESILVFHPDPASIRTVEHISKPGPNGKVVLVSYGNQLTINYTQISDPFGPTITNEDISALVISKETRAGGKAVNEKRVEKGWKALEVFEVDVLDTDAGNDEDDSGAGDKETFEAKISSTLIRKRLEERNQAQVTNTES